MRSGAPSTGQHDSALDHAGLDHPGLDHAPAISERDLQRQERFEDELIMHLERDQFVAETSRPVPSAALGRRASAGLWALRVFVLIVSAMVIYTFVVGLR
ncbi:MAG TPA: hypothetical protein VK272_11915 [Solirubrobacteraceae bacterium]|nr:hypothetical protein [Solirubrobacteraceae bacterium]